MHIALDGRTMERRFIRMLKRKHREKVLKVILEDLLSCSPDVAALMHEFVIMDLGYTFPDSLEASEEITKWSNDIRSSISYISRDTDPKITIVSPVLIVRVKDE